MITMVTLLADQLLQQTLEDRNVSSPFEQLTSDAECQANKKCEESGQLSFRSPFKEPFVPAPLSIQLCSDEHGSDTPSPGYASQAVSPTQVPPAAKRHRRSASIPGDTVSESPLHRRSMHSRQRNALVRPSVVRPDVFMAESNHSFAGSSSGTTSPSATFEFSGSGFAQSRDSSGKLLNSMSVDSCMLDCALTSEVSNELTNIYESSKDNDLPVLNVDLPERCHSQPSTRTLSRVGSLKRRREEECLRPRIDFLKMRETAFVKSESNSCTQTSGRHSLLSSEKFYRCLQSYCDDRHCVCSAHNGSNVQDSARTNRRCTDSWLNTQLQDNTVTDEPVSRHEFADDWPLLKQPPSYSSSDEDDGAVEVCKKPLLRFTGCGSADDESSVDSFGGDLDLDLIENN